MPRLSPENTLPSFAMALDAGADGLELDVHATSDGVVVVHHDPELAAGPAISTLSFAALRRHEAAPGIAIPTLAEVCELVDGRATLFVEIKGAAIERQVLAVLAKYAGTFAIHSFDHALIRRIRELDMSIRLGLLFEDAPFDVAHRMAETGAMDVWPHWSLVNPSLVETIHAAGGRIIAWTVNDPLRAAAFTELGVDALCGDDVNVFART